MIKVSVVSTKDIWKYIIKIGVIVATLFIILKYAFCILLRILKLKQ